MTNRSFALLYTFYAPVYDLLCRVLFYEKARSRAVELLQLREGQGSNTPRRCSLGRACGPQ